MGLYNRCCVNLYMSKPILTILCVFGSTHKPIFRMMVQVLHNFSNDDMPVMCNHTMLYHLFDCAPVAIAHTFAMTGGGVHPHHWNMEELAARAEPPKQSGTA